MKTKFSRFFTLLLAFVVHVSVAQEKTVTGTVTDGSGIPLPGVNILVKGSTSGTQTDFDGKYSIKASTGQILVFTYIGQKTVERTVGASNVINVQMIEDAQQLGEVVVTALGIEREKKSLGYSVQEVGGEEVSTVKDQSFISSLSGKVSGLSVKKSNSLGGSVNITLRGSNSFLGNNQALFVVDGVPISNDNLNRSGQAAGGGGYDYGNAASNLNADDIESISILKGATAAALYGSDASNGVVLITTKKGKTQRGIGVTINNSLSFSKIDESTFPKYQREYGAGYGPYYGSTGGFEDVDVNGDGTDDYLVPVGEDASFGNAFDPNVLVYQWFNLYPELTDTYLQPSPWVAPKNGPSYIFKTGVSNITSVTLEGGNDQSTFRLGYTNNDREGILPNSMIKTDVVDFNSSFKFTDKLSASAKATYTKINGKGRYGTGYDSGNVVQGLRQWFQTNVDLKQQEEAYFATKKNITWNPNSYTDLTPHYFDNPYFVFHENYETDLRNRLFGKAQLDYEFTDWMNGIARFGIDTYNDLQEERKNVGSLDQSYYQKFHRQFTEINYDFILTFDKYFGENVSFNGLVGSSIKTRNIASTFATTNGGLVIPGFYSFGNSKNLMTAPVEQSVTYRKYGWYAQASFGFNNLLYIDGTFRGDVSSTLPSDNNTYYYPSVSSSFIFSNLLEKDWLSFGKLRASVAKVSGDAGYYSLVNTLTAGAPYGDITMYSVPDVAKNPHLRPESTTEYEVGLEARMFRNRLGFDLSFYQKNTTDQIMPVQVSTGSGFNSKFVNAGEMENKGFELSLYGSPVKLKDFEWNVNVNFAKNKNKVVSLFEDATNLLIYSAWSTAVNARKGEPYGTITGSNYIYDDSGNKVVGSDGKYLRTISTTEIIGNIQPDWIGGINNTFKYKNLSLGFLIDVQKGGDIISYDMGFGRATGLYVETAGLNDLGNPKRNPVTSGPDSGGIILPGVKEDGSVNDIRVDAGTYETPYGYYGGSYDIDGYAADASMIYDASYVKLREVSLSYMLPKKFIDKLPFNNVSVGITGRNLWIIHKNLPYGDPEFSASSGNLQGIQNGSLPSTREVGFNVNLQF